MMGPDAGGSVLLFSLAQGLGGQLLCTTSRTYSLALARTSKTTPSDTHILLSKMTLLEKFANQPGGGGTPF